MAWIICIVLFCITSVFAEFYSGNWRNIQNTSWRLVKKIYDIYMMCYFNVVIGWRMQGWLKGQSQILKTAIMVPRKHLSRAIAATFWPRGRRALRCAARPSSAGPECKTVAVTTSSVDTGPREYLTFIWADNFWFRWRGNSYIDVTVYNSPQASMSARTLTFDVCGDIARV